MAGGGRRVRRGATGAARAAAVAALAAFALLLSGCTAAAPAPAEAEEGPEVAAGPPGPLALDGAVVYHRYLDTESSALLASATALDDAVRRGDRGAAQAAYADTSLRWERIEAVARPLGPISAVIEADDPTSAFRRLERDLWRDGLRPDSAAVSGRLVTALRHVSEALAAAPVSPLQVAAAAKEQLDEAITSKVTGSEYCCSGLDVAGLAANVEGAAAAVDALRLAIDARNPPLGALLTTRFAAVDDLLAAQRSGNGYRPRSDLTERDVKSMIDALDALSEPVSQLTGIVA